MVNLLQILSSFINEILLIYVFIYLYPNYIITSTFHHSNTYVCNSATLANRLCLIKRLSQ